MQSRDACGDAARGWIWLQPVVARDAALAASHSVLHPHGQRHAGRLLFELSSFLDSD
jgi:hypothetical protein